MLNADSGGSNVVRSVRRRERDVVVALGGEIDMHSSVELREVLLEVVASGPQRLVINMNEVAFMDSSGLATLIEVLQLGRRGCCELKLVGLTERVRSVLEISRLDHIFTICESEAEALGR